MMINVNTIVQIAGLITAITTICLTIDKLLDKKMKPLNESIKNLDVNQCKNFLVRFLADVEQKQKLDEVEIKRAYDVYDHYTNVLKQNSYIHDKWEKLMKEMK